MEGGREGGKMWNADAHSYPGRYSLGLAKEADHPEILNRTERDPVDSYPQEISFLITRGVTFPSGPGEGAGPPLGPAMGGQS